MIKRLLKNYSNSTIISNIYPGKAIVRFNCGISKKIKQILSQELEKERQNKPNYGKYHEYFKSKEWDIKHLGTLIQLSKKIEDYQIKILFIARGPQSEPNTQSNNPRNEAMSNMGDFFDVSAYVSKTGNEWLCADFLVNEDQTQLSLLNFIKDYNIEKLTKKKYNTTTAQYIGPAIASLKISVFDGVSDLFKQLGINTQLLKICSEYSQEYQHKFYVEWLQTFKDVL